MLQLPDQAGSVLSPSDLRAASECEYAFARQLDAVWGRTDVPEPAADPMLQRLAELGRHHEHQALLELRRRHPGPGAVRQLASPAMTHAGLTDAMNELVALLEQPAVEVVAQATVYADGFLGRVDFLERTASGWQVSDAKLSRQASVPAALQVAAYADLLEQAGVHLAPEVRLILGNGHHRDLPVRDLLPVYRQRRARLHELVAEHAADGSPAGWGDPRWLACGRCPACHEQIARSNDLLGVAGMRISTRRRLIDAGVRTVAELAERAEPVPDVSDRTLSALREQARLQDAQTRAPEGTLLTSVFNQTPLWHLPTADAGDLFFDFEADPLWREPGSATWGLEYLFGVVEVDSGEPRFRAFWAHGRREERRALVDFVDYVQARRRDFPGLHIYHYAPYEVTALLRLAARHGTKEEEIDALLRAEVFVDLYAAVRGSVRVAQPSYSLKKLEPLYMPPREGELTQGADSIVVYHQFMAARDAGASQEAARLLAEIEAYNTLDCLSTLRLRDWLLAQRSGDPPAQADPAELPPVKPPSQLRLALLELESRLRAEVDRVPVADHGSRERALAALGAALLFNVREDKPAWQRYFQRLRDPIDAWRGGDGATLVREVELVAPWERPTPRSNPQRLLRVVADSFGESVSGGSSGYRALYAAPGPQGAPPQAGHLHTAVSAVVVESAEEVLAANGRIHQRLLIREILPKGVPQYAEVPVALVRTDSINKDRITAAVAELAERALGTAELPPGAAFDVVSRRPPHLRDGIPLPSAAAGGNRFVDAITGALTSMDASYLAVQGPPGTGKTYVGAQVIARLVLDHSWRIGVCSQGHAAIENLLAAVVRAGVPGEQVGKPLVSRAEAAWTDLPRSDALAEFAAGQDAGYVIGGTAWDFTHEARVARGQLDLLVIDEAGQYSLAHTLAVSVAAQRLLLLGDPRQLPQVTTGIHPEAVGDSVLHWLAGDAPTLPAEYGYFLDSTWRMHPDLTATVSALAYDGRLGTQDSVTSARSLAGIEAGLHVVEVDHRDNATWSPEEAEAVVSIARDLIGRAWSDPDEAAPDRMPLGPRPLTPADLVVITPYNAQVGAIRAQLDAAGLGGVPVGTVDKFQGQEAAVVIVSMAASSFGHVPRGMSFLLDRRRLNVAISRGKWAAYLIRSQVLTEVAPRSVEDVLALGGFLTLCQSARSTTRVPRSTP